jgi:hypothetical protein
MAVMTWPSISSAADETIEQLNGLHLAERNRRRDGAALLQAAVARLDVAGLLQPDEIDPVPRERRDERSGRSAVEPDPVPFVALPRRTTHGGPFGPKVRDKLIAEALAGDRW